MCNIAQCVCDVMNATRFSRWVVRISQLNSSIQIFSYVSSFRLKGENLGESRKGETYTDIASERQAKRDRKAKVCGH